jgi:hypothetical protein
VVDQDFWRPFGNAPGSPALAPYTTKKKLHACMHAYPRPLSSSGPVQSLRLPAWVSTNHKKCAPQEEDEQLLRRKAVSQQKPPPPPCSPNRPSYYFPSRSRDRANQPGGDIVPRFHAMMVVHELKLRPVLTKPATTTRGEATAPPTATSTP